MTFKIIIIRSKIKIILAKIIHNHFLSLTPFLIKFIEEIIAVKKKNIVRGDMNNHPTKEEKIEEAVRTSTNNGTRNQLDMENMIDVKNRPKFPNIQLVISFIIYLLLIEH